MSPWLVADKDMTGPDLGSGPPVRDAEKGSVLFNCREDPFECLANAVFTDASRQDMTTLKN